MPGYNGEMRNIFLAFAAALSIAAASPKKLLTPNEIIAAAPAGDWRSIPPDDLLVIDLARGRGRVILQLAPAFAPVHVANIRALARAGYWDGASVYRVQEN